MMDEDLYKSIFSKNLRYYMELNNKSQIDIINDLGFNKSAVSTWVNGSRLPRMDKVDALAKYFNIKRSDLIEKRDPESDGTATDLPYYINDDAREMAQFMYENPEYKVLFDASRKISKEDIETVKTIMDRFKSTDYD